MSIDPNIYGIPVISSPLVQDGVLYLLNLTRPEFEIPITEFEPSTWLNCPFDFMADYDRWFEFHKQIHFNKKSRWRAAMDMGLSKQELKPFEGLSFKGYHEKLINNIISGLGIPRSIISISSV